MIGGIHKGQLPVDDEGHPIREPRRNLHIMGRQEDRATPGLLSLDDRHNQIRIDRIKTAAGFIQEEHRRPMQEERGEEMFSESLWFRKWFLGMRFLGKLHMFIVN